jgi:DNA modification methylase
MNNKDIKAQMFCGDCGEGDRIATLQYDLVLTDPPYDLQPEDKRILEIGAECTIRRIPLIMFSSPENQLIVPDEYQFWIKTPSTKNYSKRCGRFVEMILIDRNTSAVFNQLHWSQMIGVHQDGLLCQPVHPYEKPITLIERLIRIYSNPGSTIFDPFMGSGTTGVAAINTGRNFIGIEREKEYFNIAYERISKLL